MDDDVAEFLGSVGDGQRRRDAWLLIELMGEVTGEPAAMWGGSIVGFGARHYRHESGREGDVAAVGFSPRKAKTVLYLTGSMDGYADLLDRLGPHASGKGCLYLKRVDQADRAALREIVGRSFEAAEEG